MGPIGQHIGKGGLVLVLAVGLAFLWAVDPVEADTFRMLVVQGFNGVTVRTETTGPVKSEAASSLIGRLRDAMVFPQPARIISPLSAPTDPVQLELNMRQRLHLLEEYSALLVLQPRAA